LVVSAFTPEKTKRIFTARKEQGKPLHPVLLDRLRNFKSEIEFNHIVDFRDSKLQASQLRFFLQNIGKDALFDWGEYRIEPAEKALERIKEHPGFGEFWRPEFYEFEEDEDTEPEEPARKLSADEKRSEKIYQLMEAAMENSETRVDFERLYKRAPPDEVAYLDYLYRESPASDAVIAKALGLKKSDVAAAAESLLKKLIELV
jgi:hypothetical protein